MADLIEIGVLNLITSDYLWWGRTLLTIIWH